jgi:hypothetical protein
MGDPFRANKKNFWPGGAAIEGERWWPPALRKEEGGSQVAVRGHCGHSTGRVSIRQGEPNRSERLVPVPLVYQEVQSSRSLALKRELAIKAPSRQEKETLKNSVEFDAQPRNQKESVMAKIPSSKFSTAKKKIPSTKFPKAKRKISSGKLANQSAKIPSRKFAKAKKATKEVVTELAPLGHPTDEKSRQEAVEALKSRTDALKAGVKDRVI